MTTVQRADPRARRKAIWMICIGTMLAISLILAVTLFEDNFQSWLEENIDWLLENTIIVFVVSLVFISPVLVAGVYLLFLGKRVADAQRFPPPQYAVVRDTRVIQGQPAIWRGRVIMLLSLLLLGSAGTIPFFMWYLFHSLAS